MKDGHYIFIYLSVCLLLILVSVDRENYNYDQIRSERRMWNDSLIYHKDELIKAQRLYIFELEVQNKVLKNAIK